MQPIVQPALQSTVQPTVQSPFLTPALQFNETPYHPNDSGNLLLQFREQGFALLRNVFESNSVDAYREQMKSFVVAIDSPNNPLELRCEDPISLYPGRAPRLLQVLRGAFMPWISEPSPVMLHSGWLLRPSNPEEHLVHDWHKDADHVGASCTDGYTHPQLVHTAIYFEDMTPEMGPTYVIPRSHRDPKLSPYAGAAEAPFLPAKGDVVIWDQRLWHRASPRTASGIRILCIYGYCGVPLSSRPMAITPARREAFNSATTGQERLLLGGPFGLT